MLLRKYFTAVHRGRGAVTPIFFRLTAVWTKRLFSAAHGGSGCEEQTHLCQRSDPLRDSIDGVRQPHRRRCHARLMASRDRYRGAVPSQGRRGRSQKGNAVRVLHQTASKQRRHGATSRPSRSSSPFRNTKTHDTIRTSLYALDKAEMLDAMLALSSALYEGEAAATAVPVSGANASNNVADYAVFSSRVPPLTSSSGLGELEGVAVTGEEAYASLDAENLMCAMDACSERCNDERDVRAVQVDLGTTTPAVPPFSRTAVAHPSTADTSSSSIMATFASPDVPLERKLLQFMDLCSSTSPKSHLGGDNSDAASQRPWSGGAGVRVGNCRSDCTASSVATAWTSSTAAALVLPGLDMKAILARGVLENRHLRGLSLVRCDFSLVRWSHVTLEDCDLSRSLFYRVELDNVIFRRCNFTGCILKGVQCNPSLSPTTHFEDCDFRLAAVGLLCIPHGSQRSGQGEDQGQGISSSSHRSGPSVCFLRCNFDLSDFQFSQGLEKCKFVRCSNTHLASRFPLRARGSTGAAVLPTVTAAADGATHEDPWPQIEKQVGAMLADLNAQMQRFHNISVPTVIAENELLESVDSCNEAVEDMRFALDTAMEHPESFSITAEELQSRAERIRAWEREMMKAQQVAEKVRAAQRKRMMAQDGDADDNGTRENTDFLRQERDIQRHIMQQDDQTLDRLSSGIHRVRDTAVNIQDELKTQEHILDDIDRGMTRVQMRLEGAMKKVSKLIDSTSDRGKMICIAVLFVILVILTFVVLR